jgi:hypothetical protein
MNIYTFLASPTRPWSLLDAQPANIIHWTPQQFPGALLYEYPIALEAIEQASFAEPNWDGFGALPISGETKQNAKGAIERIISVAPTPEINPNPNGTLSFQWGSNEGTAHMEIGRTRYSFYVSPRVGQPILFEGEVSSIQRLHGGLVASVLFPPTTAAGTMTPVRYGVDV